MRIGIQGDASVFDRVAETSLGGLPVSSVEIGGDATEQQFGLIEVATVITIAKDAAELAKSVWQWWKNRRAESPIDTQTLRLRSPLGAVTIELREDVTVEELRQGLDALFVSE